VPFYVRERVGFGRSFLLLCGRTFRHVAREPSLLMTQLAVTVFVALFLGGVFFQLNSYLDGTQNRTGVLFFMTIFFSLVSMSSLGILVSERVIFLRERDAQFYTPLPYFLSQLTCDMLPLRVLPPLLFGAISYWMMGLHNDMLRFGLFLLILILVNVVATAACFLISAAVHNIGHANLIASLFFIFSMLFGGLFLNNNTSSGRFTVLQYLSFIHYGYEALMVNEFKDLPLTFNPSGFTPTQITGQIWLDNFAMNEGMLLNDLWILFGIFTIFVSTAYLFLRFSRGQYRK